MKLELKHLAPYLPYGLKFTGDSGIETELCMIDFNKNQVKAIIQGSDAESISLESNKPILHPLSDLAKEIKYNGEKLVPCNKIIFNPYYDNTDVRETILKGYESYKNITQLLKWHFDVFGLIQEGLAVDINTLK